MGELTFTTTLQARGPAAAVVLTDEQVATIGEGAKAFPVKATVNGHTWDARVSRMRGEFLVGMSKAVRTAAGAEAGDTVSVTLTRDDAPRAVEIPPALQAALDADPEAKARFAALSFTHRKEHARAIAEAKQPETRDRRVAKTIAMLKSA
jgi:hypothetical protein